jgi:hypothetical protein
MQSVQDRLRRKGCIRGIRSGNSYLASLWYILLFGLALATTVSFLGRGLPPAGDSITEMKLAGFQKYGRDCNVMIMGSSVSFHGINPEQFDRFTAKSGLSTRTFNMGMPGTHLAENYHVLQSIAQQAPTQLRWILIEADMIARVHDQGYYLNPKNIAWHDIETLGLLAPYFSELDLSTNVESQALWRNSVVTLYNTLGVGRGVPLTEQLIGFELNEKDRERWMGSAKNGHRYVSKNPGEDDKYIRQRYLDDPEKFRRKLRHMIHSKKPLKEPRISALPHFQRLEALAKTMGARVIFYTLRGDYTGCDSAALAGAGKLDSLLRLDDALRYPELFDPKYYYDGIHFTSMGAKHFTTYLAQAFLANERRASQ